jgi:hypothetical protein
MARDSRFDDLNRRVAAIEGLATTSGGAAPRENWLRRNAFWFPILTPLITVGLLIVGLVSGLFNSAFDSRISTKLNETNGPNLRIQQLSTDLASANGEIKAIRELWQEQLKKTGELNPREFKDALLQTANTLKAASALKISAPDILPSIQKNLLAADSRAPGYWGAVSQFLTYRSEQQAPFVIRYLPSILAESCNTQVPSVFTPPGQTLKEPAPVQLEHCVFDIGRDIPPYWVTLKAVDYGVGAFQFHKCLVRYGGGPIPADVFKVLTLATFDECVFAFSFDAPPPQKGEQISRALLASTATTVKGLAK